MTKHIVQNGQVYNDERGLLRTADHGPAAIPPLVPNVTPPHMIGRARLDGDKGKR
jgi:hypothetical protein